MTVILYDYFVDIKHSIFKEIFDRKYNKFN